jgi:hypothetical protein
MDYTLNTSYEFVCTICTNILKITLTARMSLKTTIPYKGAYSVVFKGALTF